MTKRFFVSLMVLIACSALTNPAIHAASNETIIPATDGEILIILATTDQLGNRSSDIRKRYDELDAQVHAVLENPLLKDLDIRVERATGPIPDRTSARSLVDITKATIVIWTRVGDDAVTVHYEITPRWKQPIQANAILSETYPQIKTFEILEHSTIRFERNIDSAYMTTFTGALILYSDQQYQSAQALFENVLKRTQSESHKRQKDLAIAASWFYVGLIRQVSRFNTAYAEQAYNQALLLNPQLAEAYINRGFTRTYAKRFVEAIADYTMAIAFKPNDPLAYIQRSGNLDSLQKYDAAIDDAMKAITLNPQDANAYSVLAASHANKGEFDKAENDFGLAIAHDPMYALAYINRGSMRAHQGKSDKAIEDYDKALEIDPNLIIAYANRADAFKQKGEVDKALADYHKAIEMSTHRSIARALGLSYVYYGRGTIYFNQAKYDEARDDFIQTIKLNPQMTAAYAWLGITYERQQNYGDALFYFQRYMAVAGDKPDPVIVNHLHFVEKLLITVKPPPQVSNPPRRSNRTLITIFEVFFRIAFVLGRLS